MLDNMILFTTLQGNASGGESAQLAGRKANLLIETVSSFIEQKSVLPLYPPSGRPIVLWPSRSFSKFKPCSSYTVVNKYLPVMFTNWGKTYV